MQALKVAVVGSGPGGMYTARTLLKKLPSAVSVDILDSLPAPFGLVRYGVAPDHQATKNVTTEFNQILQHPQCSFFGNVTVGKEVALSELKQLYHAVVLAYGAASDRSLNVPGEDLKGSFAARAFVNWYNGHPHYANLNPDLRQSGGAVIVGNGNVAIDIARILLKPRSELQTTDIADHALDVLETSKIRNVHIVGRRGPAQAAWTTAELREVTSLDQSNVSMKDDEMSLDEIDTETVAKTRAAKRAMGLLQDVHARAPSATADRALHLRFLLSPQEMIASDHKAQQLAAVRLQRNRLDGPAGKRSAVPTAETEDIECSLLFRSVGYKSEAMSGSPFSLKSNTIPHTVGRVLKDEGEKATLPGLYVSGWLKRGPTGIIGTNIADGQLTGMSIIEDWEQGNIPKSDKEGGAGLKSLLKERNVAYVDAAGWKAIDEKEVADGEKAGRPRRKLVSIDSMLQVAL